MDCLGTYGNSDIKTPHIDRLAADGVRFENSFCPFPVCTPSRYSLLSGLYVHDHHGWNNHSTLAAEIDTFPKILRQAGYKTKAVGKMHFTPTYLDVGFDEMVLSEQNGPGRWDDDYHRYLMRCGLVDRNDLEDQLNREYRLHARKEYWDTFGALVSNLPQKYHSTTWIANEAVKTLESWDSNQSGLLMAGFIKPHHPFDPPSPWNEMYDPQKLTILPGWREKCFEHDLEYSRGYFHNDKLTEPALRRVMAYYYASISQIDHHVGRMIRLLKKKGLYDNTLIIYTADHGDYMGYHHMILKGNYMYDPVMKVPLIIKWPGSEFCGTVSKSMVSNIDLAPTLCKAGGTIAGAKMRGLDLHATSLGHELIFAEYAPWREDVMARSRKHKLILSGPANRSLFFDLEKDPLEMKNLYGAGEYQDEIKTMAAALRRWRPEEPSKENKDICLDEGAAQIQQPNVPPGDLSHRKKIIDYYHKKMEILQKSST